jgi:long-chain acyl-CoA synthetase
MGFSFRKKGGMMNPRPWQKLYDPQVPKSINYPRINTYQLLERAVEKNPHGIATLFYGAKIHYHELKRLVGRFADGLASMGVKKGDRVVIILPNFPAYPIAHFGALKLGAVLVPTNPLYVERELSHQLSDSGSETVVILDKLYPKLDQIRGQIPVKRVIVAGVQDFLPKALGFLYRFKEKFRLAIDKDKGMVAFTDILKGPFPQAAIPEVTPDDVAILLYTGGTTGLSKGAVLTHGNVISNVQQTRAWLWKLEDKKEMMLCVLPFFHSYGMTTGLHLSVASA